MCRTSHLQKSFPVFFAHSIYSFTPPATRKNETKTKKENLPLVERHERLGWKSKFILCTTKDGKKMCGVQTQRGEDRKQITRSVVHSLFLSLGVLSIILMMMCMASSIWEIVAGIRRSRAATWVSDARMPCQWRNLLKYFPPRCLYTYFAVY